jgi:hypothetical protein
MIKDSRKDYSGKKEENMPLKSVEPRNVEFKFNLLCRNKGAKDAEEK